MWSDGIMNNELVLLQMFKLFTSYKHSVLLANHNNEQTDHVIKLFMEW